MKVLIYSAKDFEIPFIEKANNEVHQIKYLPERLTSNTAELALGFDVVSLFSADDASGIVLEKLKDYGVKYIALRSAGYDNVNLKMAKSCNITVANAPGYSPNAIAEHAVALALALNRKLIISDQQVHRYNFSLSNLVGFDFEGKHIGIIGAGKIGKVIAKIMSGFDCKISAHDILEDTDFQRTYHISYKGLEDVCREADILFISVPLTSKTHHLINSNLIDVMKRGVMLINIARGAIVNTKDLIKGIEAGKIGFYGADVYEYEKEIFFYDHSKNNLKDDVLKQLLKLPNVLLTPHQAFATKEALTNIASATFYNINCWEHKKASANELGSVLVF